MSDFYQDLSFPAGTADRPYVFINMVTTIDGKTVSGGREETVADIGSKFDHQVMNRIESAADAVLLGATTLRAASPKWNPSAKKRIVITNSGRLDWEAAFFTRGEAFVATNASLDVPPAIGKIGTGSGPIESGLLLRGLKGMGVERLLVLGGSTLNAQLLSADLVDELFLTLAPKIKLGKDVPTYADGEPLPRERIQNYSLLECHQVGDELFLRYRRKG